MKYESGDWVVYRDQEGKLNLARVINYLEDQDKYIVSGNPHKVMCEEELKDPDHMSLKYKDLV